MAGLNTPEAKARDNARAERLDALSDMLLIRRSERLLNGATRTTSGSALRVWEMKAHRAIALASRARYRNRRRKDACELCEARGAIERSNEECLCLDCWREILRHAHHHCDHDGTYPDCPTCEAETAAKETS